MRNGMEQAVCSSLAGASPGPGVLSVNEAGLAAASHSQRGQIPIGTGQVGKGMRLRHSAKPNGLSLGLALGATFCVAVLPRAHLR